MSKKTLRSAVNKVDLKKKDKETLIPGLLGLNSAAKQVSVPNRAGYVWVRLRNNDSEVVPVFNDQVSPVFDLPVLVVRDEIDPTRYRIYGKDSASYENWQSWSPYLPAHGGVHSRSPDSGGGDVTWVYGGQFMPLLVSPSGTSGAGNVIIDPFIYYHNDHNQYKYAGGTGTGDILVHKPTDNTAKMVLIYLDTDGNPQLLPGSTFDATVTGTSSVLQYIPTVDVDSGMPLAAARIVSGTSSVVWSNLYDLRPIITGNDKDKIAIFDDGSFQVSGTAVSFDTNLSVAVTGTVAFVSSTAAGGSSSPTYPAISDDLIFVATGTQIDFGENLSVANTGTVVFISSTDTDTPTYPAISEDGVFVATGTNIDFGANMNVVATGTSVFISAVAGGGGGGSDLSVYATGTLLMTGTTGLAFGDGLQVTSTGTIAYIDSPSALLGLSHYSGTSTEYTSNSWRTVTGTMTTFRNTFLDDVIVFVNMEANLDGGGSEEIPETHYFRISFDGDGGSGSSPVHYVEEVQSGNPDRILGMSFIRENVPIGGHTIELQTKSTTTTVRTFNTVNIGIVSSRIKPSYLLDDDYNYLLDSEGNVLLDG